MFYEKPSMKMLLDGFFVKKNRKREDFYSLFEFDRVGIHYDILQAIIKKYASSCGNGFITREFGDCSITIIIDDNQRTEIRVYERNKRHPIETKNLTIFSFYYDTDNFPSIEAKLIKNKKQNIYRIQDLYPLTMYPNLNMVIRCVSHHIIDMLVDMMYKLYLKENNK